MLCLAADCAVLVFSRDDITVINIFLRTVGDWLAIVLGTLSAGSNSSGFLSPLPSSCSSEVSVCMVGLPLGLDGGIRTNTWEPCFACLGFLALLELRVLTPSPLAWLRNCSTSLGASFSTGTRYNGEPFAEERGNGEPPALLVSLVYIVAFFGMIRGGLEVVDGLLWEDEAVAPCKKSIE